MTGEEIGRERKAKKLARHCLSKMISLLGEATPEDRKEIAAGAGFEDASEKTIARVIEILNGIAI